MKLEDQVCTYEQGLKLMKLGIKNISYFQWEECELVMSENEDVKFLWWAVHRPNVGTFDAMTDSEWPEGKWEDEYETIRSAPAFSVAELGDLLPDDVRSYKIDDIWCIYAPTEEGMRMYINSKNNKTEAQIRAAYLIELLQTKLICA